jgi:hypothetical protein
MCPNPGGIHQRTVRRALKKKDPFTSVKGSRIGFNAIRFLGHFQQQDL